MLTVAYIKVKHYVRPYQHISAVPIEDLQTDNTTESGLSIAQICFGSQILLQDW
jgi:hypothetical protein